MTDLIRTLPPDLIATILILLSAVLHAFSNAVVKIGNDKLVVRGLMGMATFICVTPFLFIVPFPVGIVWFWIGCGAVVHLLFQLVQISAFEMSDFSFAYPIMRGVAPLIIAIGAFLFLSEALVPIQWLALVMMSAGLIAFAIGFRFNGDHVPVNWRAFAVALLGALMIALYTLVDTTGVRAAPNMFTYILWIFVIDGIVINAVVLTQRGSAAFAAYRAELTKGFIGGVLGMITYGLALVALRLGNTAEIAALRETSILFGALIGAYLLKEAFDRRRMAAAVMIASAAVLLKAG